MINLSITAAWNETIAFVRREMHLLFPIAFLLGALPNAAMTLLGPHPAQGEQAEPGLWMLMMPVAFVLGLIGNIAIAWLALRPGATVGDSLGRGARRLLPLLGSALIVFVAMLPIAFVLVMLVVLAFPEAGQELQSFQPGQELSPATAGALLLIVVLVLPVAIFFGVRLSLTTPIAAAEEVGPIALIRRSWALTAGRFWKIFGFALLFGIAAAIVLLAVQFVGGAVAAIALGRPEPGNVSFVVLTLLLAVLSAILTLFFVTALTRIYAQLTGEGVAEVFR